MFRNGLREIGGADLRVGAVAVGEFFKRVGNTIVGAAALEGPASATDNAIARFDGTTGALLQNSNVTLDDSGNIITPGTLASGTQTVTGNIAVTGTVDGVDISVLSTFMPAIVVLSSNVNSTSTTTAAVSGLTFSSITAGTYIFFYGLIVGTAASTTGYKISMSYSGTTTSAAKGAIRPIDDGVSGSAPAPLTSARTDITSDLTTNGLVSGGDPTSVIQYGSIIVSTTGDLALKFGSEAAGSTATLYARSFGLLLKAA